MAITMIDYIQVAIAVVDKEEKIITLWPIELENCFNDEKNDQEARVYLDRCQYNVLCRVGTTGYVVTKKGEQNE